MCWSCWFRLCTDPADALMLLMRKCYWISILHQDLLADLSIAICSCYRFPNSQIELGNAHCAICAWSLVSGAGLRRIPRDEKCEESPRKHTSFYMHCVELNCIALHRANCTSYFTPYSKHFGQSDLSMRLVALKINFSFSQVLYIGRLSFISTSTSSR